MKSNMFPKQNKNRQTKMTTTLSLLTDMNQLCYKLNETNQTKEKIAELQRLSDPLIIKLLVYTYDPSIVFNVTSKTLKNS